MSSKSPSILINGRVTDQISVLDRGIQYGDGLFETIYIVEEKPQYWQQHMERLSEGCRRLDISLPEPSVLQCEAENLCGGIDEGILKITITRGLGGRGYAADNSAETTRVLAIFPAPQYPKEYWLEGVTVRICDTKLGKNPSLAGIKHLNRLEQVLARAEWNSNDIHEGLMLDTDNNIIEGTMSNIFSIQNNELYTPDLSQCGVKGIIRGQVINIAQQAGLTVHEGQLSLDDIYQSEELFLCNSVIGVWPVYQLENHVFKLGPISQQFIDSLQCKERGVENVA